MAPKVKTNVDLLISTDDLRVWVFYGLVLNHNHMPTSKKEAVYVGKIWDQSENTDYKSYQLLIVKGQRWEIIPGRNLFLGIIPRD